MANNNDTYVELHSHSFYSFGEGASHVHELLSQAINLGYKALSLTDHNLCGALNFARQARSLDVQPITGGEITLSDNSRIVLLAENRRGYSNISRLFSLANKVDRQHPQLDIDHLKSYSDGVLLLTGCRNGTVPQLVSRGRIEDARSVLYEYLDWFGPRSVFVELNRNFTHGDFKSNRDLLRLADEMRLPIVATNNVHYHDPNRHRLQNALVAIKHNTTIDKVIHKIKINNEFYLKSDSQMRSLFKSRPDAITNSFQIANRCTFDLSSDLGYQLPDPDVPTGYTPMTYFVQLCYEAAQRRYGVIGESVQNRLEKEFQLIEKHNLAGFMLIYREISLLAREIMIDIGMANAEEPLEWRPPGRGRGSSVAMLTGYLIGISHIDPLVYNLTLERFLPEDLRVMPDIDLDFPRAIRGRLISKIHDYFGPEFAVLSGMITTYGIKGALSDLGKALGLPEEDIRKLSDRMQSRDMRDLKSEMQSIPEFRTWVNRPLWKDLLNLGIQLQGAPKNLGQHVGGMILSSSPMSGMVPLRPGAIRGRYIMDWDKDSVADAGFAKMDILSLPVLDQLHEAVKLIESRTGRYIDLTRIDTKDSAVYDMINAGRSRGVFLLQSPAQLKMGQRLLSRNLVDLAYQVALIRPGVGMNGGSVTQFVDRYRGGISWEYDHPLEERALKRGYGIIIWQEQVVQLISDIAGMSQADADEMRRAFTRHNNQDLIKVYWERFWNGASKNGVSKEIAQKIFSKISGHYMFPESHSHAFAASAYQAAWVKCHYPVEFFASLVNNQPMGFYPLEAIKEDARRWGVKFLNPSVNMSGTKCVVHDDSIVLGLRFVKNVGMKLAEHIVNERSARGVFASIGDFVRRVFTSPTSMESLVFAGAFDHISPNRKLALWQSGLYQRPSGEQQILPLDMDVELLHSDDYSMYEKMLNEYRVMGMYTRGHIMDFMRPLLGDRVSRIRDIYALKDKAVVSVSGWIISRQHPRGREGVVFVTIEDETRDVQLVIWPHVFNKFRLIIQEPIVVFHGRISRWDGTTNVVVTHMRSMSTNIDLPPVHDWR